MNIVTKGRIIWRWCAFVRFKLNKVALLCIQAPYFEAKTDWFTTDELFWWVMAVVQDHWFITVQVRVRSAYIEPYIVKSVIAATRRNVACGCTTRAAWSISTVHLPDTTTPGTGPADEAAWTPTAPTTGTATCVPTAGARPANIAACVYVWFMEQ